MLNFQELNQVKTGKSAEQHIEFTEEEKSRRFYAALHSAFKTPATPKTGNQGKEKKEISQGFLSFRRFARQRKNQGALNGRPGAVSLSSGRPLVFRATARRKTAINAGAGGIRAAAAEKIPKNLIPTPKIGRMLNRR